MHAQLISHLRTQNMKGHELVLLGDVDEIAKPAVVDSLRHKWQDSRSKGVILQGVAYIYGFHCHRMETWRFGPRMYSIANVLNEKDVDTSRLQFRQFQKISNSSWHLSSFGSVQDIQQKFKTWGHANMFATPESLKLERLSLCALNCMIPDAQTTKKKMLPSSIDGQSERIPLSRLPLDVPEQAYKPEYRTYFHFAFENRAEKSCSDCERAKRCSREPCGLIGKELC